MSLYFIDTNIFMYAIGGPHSFREPSQKLIRMIQDDKVKAVINAEVLQEILYRYHSINKSQVGHELFDMLLRTFPIIWPISKEDLVEAKKIQEKYGIKTRDALHAGTMKRNGVKAIVSYDSDFDSLFFIKRSTPDLFF